MKDKKEKVFKGMTASVDVHLDIPEEEIWTYKIDGLADPHINKSFKNFTLKKIIFTVLLLIAVGLSMYFSVRVVSRTPFEYDEIGDGTYEFVKFNNTGYIKHLDIDYAVEIVTDKENPDANTNFTLQKDESKPISKIPQFCFNCDETVETIYIGKDVKEIDGKAFFTCRKLKQIIVDEENEYFCDIDGVLYIDSARFKIIAVPLIIDIIGFVLMAIPYIFWDYDNEKQTKVIQVLQRRAEVTQKKAQEEGETVSGGYVG